MSLLVKLMKKNSDAYRQKIKEMDTAVSKSVCLSLKLVSFLIVSVQSTAKITSDKTQCIKLQVKAQYTVHDMYDTF